MAKGLFKSRHTPKYRIKIDDVELPKGLLSQAVVDQGTNMADMFMLDLYNDCCRLSDLEIIRPGAPVTVQLGYEEHGGKYELVIQGEISVLKGNFPRRGPASIRVQGYTDFHKLAVGRKTRSFKMNKSYSDIAKLIAGEHGLKAEVDDTQTKFEYIFQRNQTDHEFLLELASRVGYEVYVRHGGHRPGGKSVLYFKKPMHDKKSVRTLVKGASLLAFNPRTFTALRPTGVQVTAWDPQKQFSEIYGEAKGKSDGGSIMGSDSHAVDVSKSMLDAIDCVSHVPLTHWTLSSKNQIAKDMAKARFQTRCLEFVEATAICPGSPDLRPGNVVEVLGVGDVFCGDYYVFRVIHDFMGSGFTTRLILRKTSIQKKQEPVKPVKVKPRPKVKKFKRKKLTWWQRIKFAVRKVVRKVVGAVRRAAMPPLRAARPPQRLPARQAAVMQQMPRRRPGLW